MGESRKSSFMLQNVQLLILTFMLPFLRHVLLSIFIPYIVELLDTQRQTQLSCTGSFCARFHIERSILSDFGFHPKPRFLNEMRPERHLVIFKVQSISVCARLYFQTDRKISRVGLKLWANTCFFFPLSFRKYLIMHRWVPVRVSDRY